MVDLSSLKGIIVPLVTPLDEHENIDLPALRRVVDFLVDGGVHALFPLGTTGEFARLEEEQKWRMLDACVAAAAGRLPVYCGISACGTRQARANLRRAADLGAGLAVLTLPFYYPVRAAAEQRLYFDQVLDGSPLPILIYNIPATIGGVIELEVVAGLAAEGQIAGIKDSGGDLAYLAGLMDLKRRYGIIVTAGAESVGLEALKLGADGLVPSLANVFPRLFVGLYDAAAAKDWERAVRFQAKIDEINRFNACTGTWLGLITFRKKALSLMGLCEERLAEPYLKLDEETGRQIAALVEEMKTWRA